jgi:hypothetical protein
LTATKRRKDRQEKLPNGPFFAPFAAFLSELCGQKLLLLGLSPNVGDHPSKSCPGDDADSNRERQSRDCTPVNASSRNALVKFVVLKPGEQELSVWRTA